MSHLHVLVEPVEHVFSGLLDVGSVCGVDVFSLSVDKPVSLTGKYLHLVVHFAFLLQICFKGTHLKCKKKPSNVSWQKLGHFKVSIVCTVDLTWSKGMTLSFSAKMNSVGLFSSYLSSLSLTIPARDHRKSNIKTSSSMPYCMLCYKNGIP